MALINSPKIVTDGLVYYHDSNNKKSYSGPPIQNLAKSITTYPQLATGISITGGTEIVDIPQLGPTNTYYTYVQNNYTSFTPNSTACCVRLIGGWGGFAVSPSTTYTYGIVYKCDSGYTSPNYMYRYEFTANGGTLVTEGGIHNNSNRVALGGGWYWAWATFTTGATTNWIGDAAMFYYQYSPFADKVSVAKVLITPGNYTAMHPQYWPEQNTTRTNTQVLSDLTRLNSITATSLTYAGDGTFSFNGGTDTAYISNTVPIPNNTFTISAWVNSSAVSGAQNVLSMNGPYFMRITGSTVRFNVLAGGTWLFQQGTTILSNNTWYYLSMVYDYAASTWTGYINDKLEFSVPKSGTLAFTSFYGYIGYTPQAGEQAPFNGKISTIQIYNRALSATEIKQNFNAIRGRYGL